VEELFEKIGDRVEISSKLGPELPKPIRVSKPRLCGNLGHRSLTMVWGTSFSTFNPEKVPLLGAKSPRGGQDGANFHEKVIFQKS
jgi:hypothetical protein